ncbi:hypothetical protein JCM14076_19150 [Methylosoma difficile]
MADKKNLVIKVKYPAGAKQSADYVPAAQTITEWNIPRLAAAAVVLAVLGVGLVKMLSSSDEAVQASVPSVAAVSEPVAPAPSDVPAQPVVQQLPATQTATAVSTPVPVAKPVAAPESLPGPANSQPLTQAETPVVSPAATGMPVGNVSRALLTHTIKKREPMTEIPRIISVGKHKPVLVHYFTEVEGLAGHDIYHEWLLDGKVVTRYKLDVAGDPWRTFSRMSITAKKGKGVWMVRLLDDSQRLLNQQTFKVNSR